MTENNARKMKKRWCKLVIMLLSVVFVAIVLFFMWLLKQHESDPIRNGRLQRSYGQILKSLDEAPEDITAQPYEAHISDIVQKDIEKMLASEEINEIVYYDDNRLSEISIIKDSESPTGIRITAFEEEYYWNSDYEISNEISFYKKEDHIVICGTENYRYARLYDISLTGEVSRSMIESLDLFGTDFSNDADCIIGINSEMTLIRNEKEFQFYKQGEKQYESTFPGGEIVEMDYEYILDDKQDLYYMYYSTCVGNPWINFVKVDEDVSEVLKDASRILDGNKLEEENMHIRYPIYMKNGKKYAGISNPETERRYGANHGWYRSEEVSMKELDFSIQVIEVSEQNVKEVEIYTPSDYYVEQSADHDWYAKFIYDAPYTVYEEKRINGLDAGMIKNIPENELDLFNGKKVSFSEVDEVVDELKQLYRRYE